MFAVVYAYREGSTFKLSDIRIISTQEKRDEYIDNIIKEYVGFSMKPLPRISNLTNIRDYEIRFMVGDKYNVDIYKDSILIVSIRSI